MLFFLMSFISSSHFLTAFEFHFFFQRKNDQKARYNRKTKEISNRSNRGWCEIFPPYINHRMSVIPFLFIKKIPINFSENKINREKKSIYILKFIALFRQKIPKKKKINKRRKKSRNQFQFETRPLSMH